MHSDASITTNTEAIVVAANEFAFQFFRSTLELDPENSNKLISPLSIYLALGMLHLGAAESTKTAITKTLQLTSGSVGQLNPAARELLQQLPSLDPRIRLSIANSIWYSNTWPSPLKTFLDANAEYYNGLIQALDFSDPSAAGMINNWVAEMTDQKIPSIINKTEADDLIYLVNAIYFNGPWLYPFDPDNTFDSSFNFPNGEKTRSPFMAQTTTLNVGLAPSHTIVELPYGEGKTYSMYLILPSEEQQDINAFTASLSQTGLQDMRSAMNRQRVRLLLPRWEYAYAIDNMQPQLAELGMGEVFVSADFSAMYPPSLPTELSKSIHKTYIKVGEVGTEAAAATVLGMRAGSALMAQPPLINFNRPFLYFILEKQTGIILFMGILADPSRKS